MTRSRFAAPVRFAAPLVAALLIGAAWAQPAPASRQRTWAPGDDRLGVSAYAPVAGIPVASMLELDPEPFAIRLGPAVGPTAADLPADALVAADPPPARTLRIVLADDPASDAAPRTVSVIAEDLADDALASALTQLVFDRGPDGRWFVAAARAAVLCRRGDVTDRFVAGPCP